MILIIIFLISIIQTVAYAVLDKRGFRKLKPLVLILVLAGYFFFFPKMFMPKLGPGAVCAMPAMGVTLAFWILGGLAAGITDIIYQGVVQKRLNLKN